MSALRFIEKTGASDMQLAPTHSHLTRPPADGWSVSSHCYQQKNSTHLGAVFYGKATIS